MRAKSLFFFVFLICLIDFSQAQDVPEGYSYRRNPRPERRQRQKEEIASTPRGYIAVNSGFGAPVGNFAVNFGTSYGNYALPGQIQSLTAFVPVNHTNVGVAVMIGVHDNAYDVNSFVNNIQLTEANANKIYLADGSSDYQETSILAGVFYTIPVKRFSFDFRLMGGLLVCRLPEVQYEAYIPQTATAAEQDFLWNSQPSSSQAFAIDLSAGVRYSLRRRLCLMGNIDFMHANVHYASYQQYVDPNGNLIISPMTGNTPISLVNISVGLGFEFGRE